MTADIFSSEIVQDLIHMHNDRIKFYKEAIHGSNNLELDIKDIFQRIIEESGEYSRQLNTKVQARNDRAGEIYKAWSDTRIFYSTGDKKSVLANCEMMNWQF